MKLGLNLGFWGAEAENHLELAQEAERLGYHSVWTAEAIEAVPDELVDEVALCGPKERIAERLSRLDESGVGTLICGSRDPQTLRAMAELVL